ncbi:hypothetical protein ACFOZ0_20780 [Streptomyces yaanensis]|uniref:Uncharacterized protein n=1 Tax=Streptomyces yaanensis TaxID=1142239 RepID=A0ABV7SGL1_9ACTN|nr:hypothetical protein [Streptomyces sp. CGMCC 4.7035]WNB97720.1 hypothetical protein Q2K21_06320 [Streptomyces sp. CGMCC 4.7035]
MTYKEVEREEVRELLGRAVDDVPVPAGRGSEAVFERASRLRWRRRAAATGAAATGAAAAVVATGLVLGPGVLNGHQEANVASTPTAGEFTTKPAGFEGLLPAGVGKIREVSLGQLIKGTKKPLGGPKAGPYDGEYAVTRDGGTGYLTVHVVDSGKDRKATDAGTDPAAREADKDPCVIAAHVSPPMVNCTTEEVSGGALLSLWQSTPDPATEVQPKHSGTELYARLSLKDGTLLTVRDWTGFLGSGSQGPLLKTFPLTRAQLRELALKPELLP